uniref:dephospho-CoA kinase n=1 Tax=Lachnospira sp. TaxID=2049031 RepID=UPI004027630F
MKVIGITGGIGAGKSEVLKYLSDNYKCEIIMTDDVEKSLYYKGSKAYQMITML